MIGAIATIVVCLLFSGACVFYIANTIRNGRIETEAMASRIDMAVALHRAQKRAAPLGQKAQGRNDGTVE